MKYAVTYKSRNGGRSVLNVYPNKATAEKQLTAIRRSKSFGKLGYSNARIRKE